MPKRMHPAEKLMRNLDLFGYKTWDQKKGTVVKHVKPLLDALENAHHHCAETAECKRLLAAWKEPL